MFGSGLYKPDDNLREIKEVRESADFIARRASLNLPPKRITLECGQETYYITEGRMIEQNGSQIYQLNYMLHSSYV